MTFAQSLATLGGRSSDQTFDRPTDRDLLSRCPRCERAGLCARAGRVVSGKALGVARPELADRLGPRHGGSPLPQRHRRLTQARGLLRPAAPRVGRVSRRPRKGPGGMPAGLRPTLTVSRLSSSRIGPPRAQVTDRERPVHVPLERLVVIAMTFHARRPRGGGSATLVTVAAGVDRREKDVRRLRAPGSWMALATAEKPVRTMVESAVREPSRGDRRRGDLRQSPGANAHAVAEGTLLLVHRFGAGKLGRDP